MKRADVIVVGGGIAGLSAARAAQVAGLGHVLLLEREGVPCAHSSGRNAAIFRHLTTTPGDLDLALRSRALLDDLLGSEDAWLRRTGTWFVSTGGDADPTLPLASLAASRGLPHRRAEGDDLHAAVPSLQGGPMQSGVFSPDDGVIDIHAVTQALVRAITAAGGDLRFGVEVAAIEADRGRATGVRLASGDRLAAGAVVLAGGAWAGTLGATCGAPLPLTPRRRHLAQIETPASRVDPGRPVVWCLGDELYYRPESSGLLVSPCDGDPWPAELPPPSQAGLELLAKKLARAVPRLADASVRRAWACLRTFAPDGAAVAGADPRVEGLHWIAGLGGHGMTGGLAAGEVLAAGLSGREHPLKGVLAISAGRALAGDWGVREKPREASPPAA